MGATGSPVSTRGGGRSLRRHRLRDRTRSVRPSARPLLQRHPGITICDQWRYCKEREDSVYKEWWAGKNVHFKGEPAAALGRLLAEHVLKVLSDGRADSGE
jgi:hypothetical protein